jgi:hypothetical protein
MHLSKPIRLALAGAALAAVSGRMPPLLSFYLALIAAACLLGAAFLGHLRAVDDPAPATIVEAAACAAAGLLMVVTAAVRFPGIGIGDATGGGVLVRVAIAIVVAAAILPPLVRGVAAAVGHAHALDARREALSKRVRRIVGTA